MILYSLNKIITSQNGKPHKCRFNDDFLKPFGTPVDNSKWIQSEGGATIQHTGGGLLMGVLNNDIEYVSSKSKWALNGEFDIRVDWVRGELGFNSQFGMSVIRPDEQPDNIAGLSVYAFYASDPVWYYDVDDGGEFIVRDDMVGKFRITRDEGNYLGFFYWNSSISDWSCVSVLGPSVEPLNVTLFLSATESGNQLWKNFKIVKGCNKITTY